jgi:uncharacterized protein
MGVQTWLEELSAGECVRHLAESHLGRLGVVVDGAPEIFPVNHVYDLVSGRVVFPSNDRTKLHAALHWPTVSFEVDGIDSDGRSGWSVLVVGRAQEVDDPDVIARALSRRLVLWGGGARSRWVQIIPEKITGRRIQAVLAVGN